MLPNPESYIDLDPPPPMNTVCRGPAAIGTSPRRHALYNDMKKWCRAILDSE